MDLERAATAGLAARLFPPGSLQGLALLRAAWPRAVGSELARRTELLALDGSGLLIRVPDARWRKVLHRMRREILARLREATGDHAPGALRFAEGAIAELPELRPVEASPALAALPPAVAREALSIMDPEIRRLFLEAAGRYLAQAARRASLAAPGANAASRTAGDDHA